MRKAQHILSLCIFCIYTLFLFHDFIPHSHPDISKIPVATVVAGTSYPHHSIHQNSASNVREDTEQDISQFRSQGTSDSEAHHHNLVYKASSKNDYSPQYEVQAYLVSISLDRTKSNHSFSLAPAYLIPIYIDPPALNLRCLRAPPTLV